MSSYVTGIISYESNDDYWNFVLLDFSTSTCTRFYYSLRDLYPRCIQQEGESDDDEDRKDWSWVGISANAMQDARTASLPEDLSGHVKDQNGICLRKTDVVFGRRHYTNRQ